MARKVTKAAAKGPVSIPSPVSVPSPVAVPSKDPAPAFGYGTLSDFGREAIDATARSNAALSAGIEAIGAEIAGLARASFASAAQTARALLAARTFDDVLRLQADWAKAEMERLVERSTKVSDLGYAAAQEALASWASASQARRPEVSRDREIVPPQ